MNEKTLRQVQRKKLKIKVKRKKPTQATQKLRTQHQEE